ncbi:MAG: hypothetical protein K2R98_23815 [Gemmataceae bacterium]|nr:hypothetical protein [Gemmataceae bacterium]
MRNGFRVLLCPLTFLCLTLGVGGADDKSKAYPPSRVEKVMDKLHGVEVPDPYRWLEDGNAAEVKEWTEKQNAHTRGILDKAPGRDKIRARLDQLLETGNIGTPVPVKGHYYYTRRDGNQNQPILYVREGASGKDRVLIDPNELSKEGTTALDWWFPSRDGKLLAYGLSKDGSEQSVLRVRDVASGKDLSDVIERTRACSVAWLPDSKGFYYTRYPALGSVTKGEESYHRHVFFHKLGDDPREDPEIFGKGRPAEDWPSVNLSPDGRWLVVTESQGWAKSEVYFKDMIKEGAEFKPLVQGVKAIFSMTVRNDFFYVLTNDGAPRYRYYRVDPSMPDRKNWLEVIQEDKERVLQAVAVIGKTLIADYMRRATSQLQMGATAFSTRETAILHGKNKVFGHSETGKSTINAQIWAAIAARN